MITINLTNKEATTLKDIVDKIIPAERMLDERRINLTYAEVMVMIKLANQLNETGNVKSN